MAFAWNENLTFVTPDRDNMQRPTAPALLDVATCKRSYMEYY